MIVCCMVLAVTACRKREASPLASETLSETTSPIHSEVMLRIAGRFSSQDYRVSCTGYLADDRTLVVPGSCYSEQHQLSKYEFETGLGEKRRLKLAHPRGKWSGLMRFVVSEGRKPWQIQSANVSETDSATLIWWDDMSGHVVGQSLQKWVSATAANSGYVQHHFSVPAAHAGGLVIQNQFQLVGIHIGACQIEGVQPCRQAVTLTAATERDDVLYTVPPRSETGPGNGDGE